MIKEYPEVGAAILSAIYERMKKQPTSSANLTGILHFMSQFVFSDPLNDAL